MNKIVILGFGLFGIITSLFAMQPHLECNDFDNIVSYIQKSSVKPEKRLILCGIDEVVLRCQSFRGNEIEQRSWDVLDSYAIIEANKIFAKWINSGLYELYAMEGGMTAYVISQLRELGDFVFVTNRPFSCHEMTLKQLEYINIPMIPQGPGNLISIKGPQDGIPDELWIVPDRKIIYCANGSKTVALKNFLASCEKNYSEVVVIENRQSEIDEMLDGCSSIGCRYSVRYVCQGLARLLKADDKPSLAR